MVTAMGYVLRTGLPWRDLPERFGPWSSVYTRFRRWYRCGLWARLFQRLRSHAWGQIRSLDCSHVKVHADGANPAGGQSHPAMGRTKGGLNTKVATTVDALGRPVPLAVGRPGRSTTCSPMHPACRAGATAGCSLIAGSMPMISAGRSAIRASGPASRHEQVAAGRAASAAAFTDSAIPSRTFSPGSNVTAVLLPATKNSRTIISASCFSPLSSIGSSLGFEDTP